MKLRTQLILAFLLLAVIPLGGMTLYSYRSSLAAFHEAVEAEAGAMTEQIGARMEVVTADLTRRMDRLESLPYETLMAESAGEGSDGDAGPFLARLQSELGDAVSWIETLEYQPMARPPHPPRDARGATHRPPTAERPPRGPAAPSPPVVTATSQQEIEVASGESDRPMVIHLNRELFRGRQGEARVIRSGNNWVMIPREVTEIEQLVGPGLLASLKGIINDGEVEAVIERIADTVAQRRLATHEREVLRDEQLAEHAAAIDQATERWAAAIEKAAVDRGETPGEFRKVVQDLGMGEAVRRMAETASSRAPRFELGREFACDVRQDGETVGQVKAQFNGADVLRSVLADTPREKGEISFAIDGDGTLHTSDPESHAVLEQLGLVDRVARGGVAGPTQIGDNWVVQTRDMPEMDVVFGIARPVGEGLYAIRRTAGRNLGIGLGIVFVAMLGIVPISSRMTRNLSLLTEGAEKLAKGDLDVRVPIRSKDEIGALGRTFNRMGADLQANQHQLLHQERLKKELEMCRQIQDEMLPLGRLSFPFADVRAVSIPAREVGGDFFNYFALPNGDIALLMGDVSGKGVAAALMMAHVQAKLQARLPLEPDLAQLARALDVEIEASTRPETYVTLFMGVIDVKRQVLRYVNAGHNTQYLVGRRGDENVTRQFESSGRPLGLFSGGPYVECECPLLPGDLLFLFTDGVTEAASEDGEEFGVERLQALLLSQQGGGPDTILERVEQALASYCGNAEPADDATLLVLRFDTPRA